ncbi:MAG: quinol:electron acceptor oxidoreductase subunit ActD [Candidatus Kapaibacteriota bacterium]
MDDKNLYGVACLFKDPDKLLQLVKKIKELGFKNWDVHSAYPLHGIPKAMSLKWSPLGYIALILGLTGALFGLFLTWWTMSVDYPLIIGGKPWFSFPAFVPVLFELTVLLASVGTAVVMLFIIFKLPNNRHPLNDTEYMQKVSSEYYGLVIEAKDPNFDYNKVVSIFKEFEPSEILDIIYQEAELNFRPKVFDWKFILFLVIVSAAASSFAYFYNNKVLYLPPFDFMLQQFKLKPQESFAFFSDNSGMRNPVPGTVARGEIFYPFKGKPEEAGAKLVNTLEPTEENLKLGQAKFNTFCSPCHGWRGEGDSRLNGQFPNPPSLHTEKLRNWPDGRIYHVIVEGQNIMPSYARQLNEKERWAIVLYIRALQRSLNAKQEDLQ